MTEPVQETTPDQCILIQSCSTYLYNMMQYAPSFGPEQQNLKQKHSETNLSLWYPLVVQEKLVPLGWILVLLDSSYSQ